MRMILASGVACLLAAPALAADPAARTPMTRGAGAPVVDNQNSKVAGREGPGWPEATRDARGFAVKFYTDQGNCDVVGINAPIFFIRGAIKFPDISAPTEAGRRRSPGSFPIAKRSGQCCEI